MPILRKNSYSALSLFLLSYYRQTQTKTIKAQFSFSLTGKPVFPGGPCGPRGPSAPFSPRFPCPPSGPRSPPGP